MTDWREIDYFNDASLIDDPYPYFDSLRDECPVLKLDHLGVVAVTGYDEANEVYRHADLFSSCNALVGPFAPFPVAMEGDDISGLIAEHRHHMPMYQHMVTMDPPDHTHERGLLMRLITPKRLKENEDFMWRLADKQLDEILPLGGCEFVNGYAQSFAMLAVADVLGVPEEDHQKFREGFGMSRGPGRVGAGAQHEPGQNSLSWLDDYFTEYVEDRRANPRGDVMTQLALATYEDGSTPPVENIVRTATFLFAAGQETTVKLLAEAMKYLSVYPEIQARLREDKSLITPFLEEVLRLESPVKTDFRLTVKNTSIAGVDIPAGTPLAMMNGAANRDPSHFENPNELSLDRANAQSHIAFGRGVHSCPGGPLARAEGRISLERILDRTSDIRLSEEHHGKPGEYHFRYSPTWLLRGITAVHLEFDAV